MADNSRTLLEQGAGDALGEGAARFERVIESVKRQQAVAPEALPQTIAVNPLLSASPGEEWARRFQTQAIGPDFGPINPGELPSAARAMILPAIEREAVIPSRTSEFVPKRAVEPVEIGFGRPQKPKKSWIGRMFSRA